MIMKKTYIAPNAKSIFLEAESLIAISGNLDGTGDGGNISEKEGGYGDGGDSHRRTTIWDNTEW